MTKTKHNLEGLFSPQSIAVVGATDIEGKVGRVVAKNLLDLNYQGEIVFVNPKYQELFGRKCYPSLDQIENPVDLAIVIVPAQFVNEVVSKGSMKAKNFVVISAGFSEIGEEGKVREEALAKIAKKNKVRLLGPNCLGFINPHLLLNASFAGGMPKVGNIAFVSQSGALAVAFLDRASKEQLGFSKVISVGNKTDVDESVMIEYLANDPDTKVIALYLEGIKDGQKFIEIAQKFSSKKPIIILKAGKGEKAQKAISSHTGALAGADEIMDAVFDKTGVIRAESIEEFFALVTLFSNERWQKMRTVSPVAIVTNAGGPGVLTTDAFENQSIKLAEIPEKTRKILKTFLPAEASVGNPIDLLGDANEQRYQQAIVALEKDKTIGSILALLTPQDQTPVDKIADCIIEEFEKENLPIFTSFIGGVKVEQSIQKLQSNNIVHFDFPELAVKVLAAANSWSAEKKSNEKEKTLENQERSAQGKRIIDEAVIDNRKALLFEEARHLSALYHIPAIHAWDLNSLEDITHLKIEYPCVAKINSDTVLHKTDKKGVILGIKNNEELSVAYSELQQNFPGEKVLVQPMLPIKMEMILGIKRDPVFGPIVVAGLGGIYTEVFRRVEFFVPPLTQEEVEEKLSSGNLGFLFRETRGQKPYNLQEFAQIILNLSQMATELPEIAELDINPILVYNDGKPAVAVDVKVIL